MHNLFQQIGKMHTFVIPNREIIDQGSLNMYNII